MITAIILILLESKNNISLNDWNWITLFAFIELALEILILTIIGNKL